jgi:hypothetical protein
MLTAGMWWPRGLTTGGLGTTGCEAMNGIRGRYWCTPPGNITGGGGAMPLPIHIICTSVEPIGLVSQRWQVVVAFTCDYVHTDD